MSGALFDYLLRMGDTTLILSHRLSEWCGHAPTIEEDLALPNVALDLIGQTRLWLGLAGEVEGRGRDADALAYLRTERQFRNLLLVEQPNGDFALTLARQFLFDAWHLELLGALTGSRHERIAEIAAKGLVEARYHLARSGEWVVRLGDGTEESQRRTQTALDALWRYTGELFEGDAVEDELAAAGTVARAAGLKPAWDKRVTEVLAAATLTRPADGWMARGGKTTGVHTEHLGYLLAEMQSLPRAYPGARW